MPVLQPVLAAALLLASGCSAPLMTSVSERELRTRPYEIIEGIVVPEVTGTEGCGAQALAAVLAHVDPALEAGTVAAGLPWHDVGATPVELLVETRRRGYEARLESGTWEGLTAHVVEGRPVLVMIDAASEIRFPPIGSPTGSLMHWAVVSGMSRDGATLLLGATGSRHHRIARADFMRRWAESDHCAIVVTAAGAAP